MHPSTIYVGCNYGNGRWSSSHLKEGLSEDSTFKEPFLEFSFSLGATGLLARSSSPAIKRDNLFFSGIDSVSDLPWMSSKGIPGDKNGSNPTWSHNQAFGTHFMIFSQFSRGSKHYIIYLSIFQKTILGMIIFNVTIDSAIMAKLTNLGIIRCIAEDNWPKPRLTPVTSVAV